MPDRGDENCRICGSAGVETVFRSANAQSLTSLCQLRPGGIEVSLCDDCGHLRSNELEDIKAFYETEFKMLTGSIEEDQIYEKNGNEITYRTDHQLSVLTSKHNMASGSRVLDYGCAKADMSRKLKQQRVDIDIHLFDVSRMYLPFWEQLTDESHWAIDTTPDRWEGHFDLVMSFFAFEHIPNPLAAARHVFSLLAPGGAFHLVIPDVFGNIADFVVCDHVNHFTTSSLSLLLAKAGFSGIEISSEIHRGALVARAVRTDNSTLQASVEKVLVDEAVGRAREIAEFWRKIDVQLNRQNTANSGPAAIYGSGFYGAYIFSRLNNPEQVMCFLDQSPYQQGRILFNLPILAPDQLPSDATTIYVGLNPAIARRAMESMPELKIGGRQLVFLT